MNMLNALRAIVSIGAAVLIARGFKAMGEGWIYGFFSAMVFWQCLFRLKHGYWFDPD